MAFIDFERGESDLPASTARRVAFVLMPPIGGDFKWFVHQRFGALSAGEHAPDEGAACVLEAAAAWRGLEWTDDPKELRVPDIRPLNDAFRDDETRTDAMVRVYQAVADWAHWSAQRRARFAERVVVRTAQDVVAEALWSCGLGVDAAWLAAASSLSQVATRAEAAKWRAYSRYPACGYAYDATGHMAEAARAASAPDADTCAAEVARAVFYSARAVPDSAAVGLLQIAVAIWVEASR